MKIKWNGHASFTITSDNGTVIVTDPYDPDEYGDELTYTVVGDSADGVLVSHEHPDHSYVQGLPCSPTVLKGSGEINGIAVSGIKTFHDDSGGAKRGPNTVFRFAIDRMSICFLGDLGHILSPEQMTAIGRVDILFLPVGGTYTLDASMAARSARTIGPRVVIPMHFKTEKCRFPIAGVHEFLARMEKIKTLNMSEIKVDLNDLPDEEMGVWVMDYAC
jgi:L-ascorbate metabolism protein UlaG (beta-lactamase superfamily)